MYLAYATVTSATPVYEMQPKPSYLLGKNKLVGLAYVQNLGLLIKRGPGSTRVDNFTCHTSLVTCVPVSLNRMHS